MNESLFQSGIILFREGFEAFLIMFLVLGFLSKSGYKGLKKYVYTAAVSAIAVSIITALIFQALKVKFEGLTEYLFEGIVMVATSIMLAFMILWLVRFKTNTGKIKAEITAHAEKNYGWGIFSLVFISVLREGIETVLFFIGLDVQAGWGSLLGGAIGFVAAFILCYGIFAGTIRLNFKAFFNITTGLLLFIAAGLMAHGIHELHEAKVVPEIIEHVWDINPPVEEGEPYPLMHDKGIIGKLLSAIFGYNGNPSLVEVIMYVLYLIIVGGLWYRFESMHKKKQLKA